MRRSGGPGAMKQETSNWIVYRVSNMIIAVATDTMAGYDAESIICSGLTEAQAYTLAATFGDVEVINSTRFGTFYSALVRRSAP